MKDLKDIAKGIAIGIMLGLVIVFGFVIASLTGCMEAGRMLTLPVATEEEATLEPTEDPAVKAGLIRYGPGVDTVPKGYLPVNVGPDGSIVLAHYFDSVWKELFPYWPDDELPNKTRIAMDPNLKHIRVYPVVEAAIAQPEGGIPEDYIEFGELTTYTLLEAALTFGLEFCVLPDEREGCLSITQAEWEARLAWEEEERKKNEW